MHVYPLVSITVNTHYNYFSYDNITEYVKLYNTAVYIT